MRRFVAVAATFLLPAIALAQGAQPAPAQAPPTASEQAMGAELSVCYHQYLSLGSRMLSASDTIAALQQQVAQLRAQLAAATAPPPAPSAPPAPSPAGTPKMP